MYLILACSLASWTVILERSVYFFRTRLSRRRIEALQTLMLPGASRGEEPFARLRACHEALADRSAAEREQASRWEAGPFLRRDNRGLAVLSAVAGLGPLLGLFGTVLGMIELFRSLAESGVRPEFSSLVGGIWTALLTTGFGLVAALPALVAHQTFDHWATRRAERLEEFHGRLERHR